MLGAIIDDPEYGWMHVSASSVQDALLAWAAEG